MRRRRIKERIERRVEFLGAQDGVSERTFIAAITPLLRASPSVQRAYLARLGFAPGSAASVALCLAAGNNEDRSLIASVLAVFKEMAPTEAFLDILFLDDEQEEDLRRVCPPFFQRSER